MCLGKADRRNHETDCVHYYEIHKLSWKIDIYFFKQEYLDSIEKNVWAS